MPLSPPRRHLARQLNLLHCVPWRRNLIRFIFCITLAAALLALTPGADAQIEEGAAEELRTTENSVFTEHDVETPAADTEFSQDQGRHEEEWYDPSDWIDTESNTDIGAGAETDFWDDDYTQDYNKPYRAEVVDTPDTSYYDPHLGEDLRSNDYRFGYEYDDSLYSDYYTDDWYDDDSAFNQWYED